MNFKLIKNYINLKNKNNQNDLFNEIAYFSFNLNSALF